MGVKKLVGDVLTLAGLAILGLLLIPSRFAIVIAESVLVGYVLIVFGGLIILYIWERVRRGNT